MNRYPDQIKHQTGIVEQLERLIPTAKPQERKKIFPIYRRAVGTLALLQFREILIRAEQGPTTRDLLAKVNSLLGDK